MRTASVGGRVVRLSAHCVDRFHERLRPSLGRGEAQAEMLRLLEEFGEVWDQAPGWLRPAQEDPLVADVWLVVGDAAFPVRGGVVLTCVVQGGLSDAARARRSEWKRLQRERARSKRLGPDPRGR